MKGNYSGFGGPTEAMEHCRCEREVAERLRGGGIVNWFLWFGARRTDPDASKQEAVRASYFSQSETRGPGMPKGPPKEWANQARGVPETSCPPVPRRTGRAGIVEQGIWLYPAAQAKHTDGPLRTAGPT